MSDKSIVGQWTVTEQWVGSASSPAYPISLTFNEDGSLTVPGHASFTGSWQQNGSVVMFILSSPGAGSDPDVSGSYIGLYDATSGFSGSASGFFGGPDTMVLGVWSGKAATASVASARPSGRPLNLSKRK